MILIINTANSEKIFLGLVSKGKLVAKKEFKARYKHAEKLLPEINKLLKIGNCQLTTISGVAVASGPGSFTALRIGITTANTLAWALNIPIIGLRLTEFTNILDLVKLSGLRLKKTKTGKLVEPFYGKEPNITFKKALSIVVMLTMLLPAIVFAQINALDSDGDGLSDEAEQTFYYTDPFNADTDNDGFNDKVEIENGYSPHFANLKLIDSDLDSDGLCDKYETDLKTDLKNPDSDGDGFSDGQEFDNEYDPRTSQPIKLEKKIIVYLSIQRLKAYLGPVKIKEYVVSTGKASTPTPVGSFSVTKKNLKAWSQAAGLWMPYWMQFKGAVAFHELPEWPNGQKEGADHLGTPVSHGCVRLGIGSAKELYDWTPVGTKVVINK